MIAFLRGHPIDDFVARLLDGLDNGFETPTYGSRGTHNAVVTEHAKDQLAIAAHLLRLLLAPRNLVHERVLPPRLAVNNSLGQQADAVHAASDGSDDGQDGVLAVHRVGHALVRQAAIAGPKPVQTVERTGDSNGAANVGSKASWGPLEADEGALAT